MANRILLPHSDQFDEMNANLKKIAYALGTQIDTSTWVGIQQAVRAGVAPNLFPIGTQFMVSHTVYGDHLYDVVAHNYFKSARDENAHTMTLMCHDAVDSIQYDAPEAFTCTTLVPGMLYSFNVSETIGEWHAGTYYFAPKAGGGPYGEIYTLAINGDTNGNIWDNTISAYDKNRQVVDSFYIMVGGAAEAEGYDLDSAISIGGFSNHPDRVVHGSNNYKESAIRQFLNSSAEVGKVWSPQTQYDMPPSWATTLEGFMKGLDKEFLDVVGKVVVPCSANNVFESPDSTVTKGAKYTVEDKFYFASTMELFGTNAGSVADGSVCFPYYHEATNADRIKYRGDVAKYLATRSANAQNADVVRVVSPTGEAAIYHPNMATGCVPVCTIV